MKNKAPVKKTKIKTLKPKKRKEVLNPIRKNAKSGRRNERELFLLERTDIIYSKRKKNKTQLFIKHLKLIANFY